MKEAVLSYIESQPNSVKEVLFDLREIVLSVSPGITEEFKWKVPFYYYTGPICYFNVQQGIPVVGFYRGKQLLDEDRVLKIDDLKQVAHLLIHPKQPLPEDYLRDFLFQSIELDTTRGKLNARGR